MRTSKEAADEPLTAPRRLVYSIASRGVAVARTRLGVVLRPAWWGSWSLPQILWQGVDRYLDKRFVVYACTRAEVQCEPYGTYRRSIYRMAWEDIFRDRCEGMPCG